MSKTVICRVIPQAVNGTGGVAILEIHSKGEARRLTISRSQDYKLEHGDTIKSISGKIAVMINPGTGAGMFVLLPQVTAGSDWKFRTELVIDDESTKIISRGTPTVSGDIGNVSRIGGFSTR